MNRSSFQRSVLYILLYVYTHIYNYMYIYIYAWISCIYVYIHVYTIYLRYSVYVKEPPCTQDLFHQMLDGSCGPIAVDSDDEEANACQKPAGCLGLGSFVRAGIIVLKYL